MTLSYKGKGNTGVNSCSRSKFSLTYLVRRRVHTFPTGQASAVGPGRLSLSLSSLTHPLNSLVTEVNDQDIIIPSYLCNSRHDE